MKKVTCLLAALLLACGLSWAQTTDVLNHDVIGVNGTSYSTWTGITSNSDAVYAGNTAGGNNATQMRSNNNNSGIVTTASGGVVTNITVVWNENTTAGRTLNVYGKNAAYSAATDLYGNNAGTLIGTIVCNEGESTELDIDDEYAFIGIRSNSGALYLDEVSITWGEGSGVTPPSIEASNVEIAYDATEGAIAYTINNPVDGGELTAATEAEWLTVGTVGETVPFTCTVNEDGAAREAVVTLTYTYGEQAINQAVTVTQAGNPNALDNISDITATGAYAVQGTIVAMSQRGFIVGDGTGYVYYYNQNYAQGDYNIGDMVKLAGNVSVYGGVFEFTSAATVTPANSSNYVAEDPTVITGGEMDARVASTTPAQLSNYVQYEGVLSVNNTHYNITNIEGATTAQGSISYPLNTEFAALNGKHVKVSGYFVGISSSTYYNTMIGTVEEVVSTEPSITINPSIVNATAEGGEGTLEVTYQNITPGSLALIAFCDADGMPAAYDWFDAEIDDENNVYYLIDANEGEARTGYFKVYVMDEAYSNIVTINQEAYVAPQDASIDPADILYWIGEGDNEVVFIVNWAEPDTALAWGYRFSEETVTVKTIMDEITAADYRFSYTIGSWGIGDILFNDGVLDLGITNDGYWMYNVNGELAQVSFDQQTVVNGNYVKCGDTNCGTIIDPVNWVFIWEEEVVAVYPPVLDYAMLPFEFNGGRADIEGTDGLTYEGLGNDYNSAPKLKFDGTGDWLLLHFEGTPGELAFDIKGNSFSEGTFTVQTSEDGETYTDFATYTELGATEHEVFNNLGEDVRYIKWIYTEKVNGNVALGNITLGEYTGPVASITVTPATVEVDAEEHEGTLALAYENLEISDMTDFDIQYYDAEGEETETPDWIEVLVAEQDPEIGEGYVVSYYMFENEGEARSAYFKVFAAGDEDFVYSNLITINQEEYVAPVEEATFWKTPWIESGRHYIITNGVDKAMGGQNNNNRAAVAISIEDNMAIVNTADVCQVVINGPDANGFYTIYDANESGYLYGAGANSSNYLRTETFCDNRAQWSISIDEETGAATIVANFEGRNTIRYNNSNDIFSCYGTGQQDVYLFMKDYDESYEFYTDIKGYGGNEGNWYLLGIPVNNEVDPAEMGDMVNGTFDLYMFDQAAAGAEWQNYKVTPFLLNNSKGYLYADSVNITLKYVGDAIFNASVNLDYVEGAELAGWNLIGNPFGTAATIGRDFYVMNEEGTELELAERGYINPFEGVFVEAAEPGESVTFVMEDDPTVIINAGEIGGDEIGFGDDWNKLNIRVSDNMGHGDFARIRFGEGRTLNKFMFNESNNKLYFVQDNEEYAVVRSEAEGEMPLYFKTAADGTYTLTVNAANIEMEYLHLIDNMTGTEVDLLANPSYSFNARVNDNAARFTLVFAGLTGIEENSDNFAFFSNGKVIVSNEGNAMLQLVDMNGRIVKSENINGTTSVSVEAAPGVYMLRLVNGDNMKVQKIIVK